VKGEPFLAVGLAIVLSGVTAAGAQNSAKVMQSQQPNWAHPARIPYTSMLKKSC